MAPVAKLALGLSLAGLALGNNFSGAFSLSWTLPESTVVSSFEGSIAIPARLPSGAYGESFSMLQTSMNSAQYDITDEVIHSQSTTSYDLSISTSGWTYNPPVIYNPGDSLAFSYKPSNLSANAVWTNAITVTPAPQSSSAESTMSYEMDGIDWRTSRPYDGYKDPVGNFTALGLGLFVWDSYWDFGDVTFSNVSMTVVDTLGANTSQDWCINYTISASQSPTPAVNFPDGGPFVTANADGLVTCDVSRIVLVQPRLSL